MSRTLSPRLRVLAVRAAVVAAAAALFVAALASWPGDVRWGAAWEWRGALAAGLLRTLVASAGALVVALVLGTLAGLARVSSSLWLRESSATYVQLVRGTPFLVQVYLSYFCLATLFRLQGVGGEHNALIVGTLGLGIFGGAYVTEVVRAGVEAVDRGQWEAARSLGLSHRQALRHVVLPQALRTMLPPLTGEAVSLLKESSLLSVISVGEMTYHAERMKTSTYDAFAAYVPLALLYLALTLPLTLLAQRFERRLAGPRPFPVAEL